MLLVFILILCQKIINKIQIELVSLIESFNALSGATKNIKDILPLSKHVIIIAINVKIVCYCSRPQQIFNMYSCFCNKRSSFHQKLQLVTSRCICLSLSTYIYIQKPGNGNTRSNRRQNTNFPGRELLMLKKKLTASSRGNVWFISHSITSSKFYINLDMHNLNMDFIFFKKESYHNSNLNSLIVGIQFLPFNCRR